MRDDDRRRHFRYRDPINATLHFLIRERESERALTALTVDESHAGLSCVYVGPALDVGREILWQETEGIRTLCRVMRCQQLHPDVHLIALRILG